MTDKIKELLTVLDLPQSKQRNWLWNKKLIHEVESLADLAFRLRDEALLLQCKTAKACIFPYGLNAGSGCWTIAKTVTVGHSEESMENFICLFGDNHLEQERIVDKWCTNRALPIHFIIAALIAKELAK